MQGEDNNTSLVFDELALYVLKKVSSIVPTPKFELELYFPFQLLMKTCRDQKLDTLVNKISNFNLVCCTCLFTCDYFVCFDNQLPIPIILGKEDGGGIATTTKSLGICAHLVFHYMKSIWDHKGTLKT